MRCSSQSEWALSKDNINPRSALDGTSSHGTDNSNVPRRDAKEMEDLSREDIKVREIKDLDLLKV
jgi:hypothetical protein